MTQIKLTVDGKEIVLTEEQIKSLGLDSKKVPEYNLLGQMIKNISYDSTTYIKTASLGENRYNKNDSKRKDWSDFKDEASAECFDKKLQALKDLWDWKTINDGEFVPDWKDNEQDKHTIYYNHAQKRCIESVYAYNYIQTTMFIPYFSTYDITKKCIEECKSQLDILFDIN